MTKVLVRSYKRSVNLMETRPERCRQISYLGGMKYWIFLLFTAFTFAQAPELSPLPTAALDAEQFFGRDASGAYYAAAKDHTFFRWENGIRTDYQDLSLGRIARADLRNPLRIVLFYADFNAVVMLDNQLNEIQRILFSEMEMPLTVTACGLASQNRVWIYDALSQRIGLFDYLKKTVSFITQPIEKPLQYGTDFNDFYWTDDKGTLYKCDIFGKILWTGAIAPTSRIVFTDDYNYIVDGTMLRYVSDLAGTEKPLLDLGKTIRNIHSADGILSIFTGREIMNYKITLR